MAAWIAELPVRIYYGSEVAGIRPFMAPLGPTRWDPAQPAGDGRKLCKTGRESCDPLKYA
jgi:hypothetical protein